MTPLELKLIERIRRDGPITFEQFMDAALYDPDFGYYTSGIDRIGRAGDFYTSSHLHPSFGGMIGRQIEQMWEAMGRTSDFLLLEMGAGMGHVCKDMLERFRGSPFFDALTYMIIEASPQLRPSQEALLEEYSGKVFWSDSVGDVRGFTGCVFSNELLDAFPVHLVQMEEELREIYVDAGEYGLIETTGPLSRADLSDYFSDIQDKFERGYRTEANFRMKDWISSVDSVLQKGFVFTIDYGYTERDYYSEDRNRGTLMCYRGHNSNEDPLQFIGEQDLTAHVNFSALARWGEGLGFKTNGFCSQGNFLISMGIDEEIRLLAEKSDDYQFELNRIKKLFMPQGMGESHMVMVQQKGMDAPALRGFSFRNRLGLL